MFNQSLDAAAERLECLIVGAGIAGLTAARHLLRAGLRPTILERTGMVGGRMASCRFAGDRSVDGLTAVFDHGAQYFTVRDALFESAVQEWLEIGLVRQWSVGFAVSDGSLYLDGQPRYAGYPDMAAIPGYLARDLDVRLNAGVSMVQRRQEQWQISTQNGRTFSANSLIMTTPVPETLSLLEVGSVSLPPAKQAVLERIEYEPCIALLILLEGAGKMTEPGGMWSVGSDIAWMADNYIKGLSAARGAITIHAGPEFSRDHWHSDDEIIIHKLLTAADEWLGRDYKEAEVVRWPFSKPYQTYHETCCYIEDPGSLVLAGDAFAGPRVEGAYLSGLAAAEAVL